MALQAAVSLSFLIASSSSLGTTNDSSFELIGAGGRIGSLFKRLEGCTPLERDESSKLPTGRPLVVCTPSSAWDAILETFKCKENDLVWFGNGIPIVGTGTHVVPHFGVLKVHGEVVTSQTSPPTYIYGRHARFVEEILRRYGIHAVRVQDFESVQAYAVRKLLWASCLWLLCHTKSPPFTVSEVHDQRPEDLERLVKELWPAVSKLTKCEAANVEDTLLYMEQYSRSMSVAIPSLTLAISELKDRNGCFYEGQLSQPYHHDLLTTLAGRQAVKGLLT